MTDIDLRAGDTDREATADRLRHSHSEGRIDSDEFATRIDRCYDAKTMGELQQLVSDLPPERPRREPISMRRSGVGIMVPVIVAAVALAAISAHGGFWFVFPMMFMARFWLWRRWPFSARRRV